jgi:uncharacterized protein
MARTTLREAAPCNVVSRLALPAVLTAVLLLPVCNVHSQQSAAAIDQQPSKAEVEANVATITRAYEAFSRGDVDTVMAAFSPAIEWYVPGRGPLSRTYRGHADVLGFFDHFMKLSNGTFRLQVNDVLGAGERVVVLCTSTAQRAGRTWTSPQVHVWTLKNGQAVAFREYEGDQQAEDEFWALQE